MISILTTYDNSSSDDSLVSHPPSCPIIQIPLDTNQPPPPSLPSLGTKFSLHLKVSEACYRCYDGKGECRLDDKEELKCSVGKKGYNSQKKETVN
ncbi:unnamed protein product [Prunus armeniaca]|nr:unnamed protein product [Prunus armeniaca]